MKIEVDLSEIVKSPTFYLIIICFMMIFCPFVVAQLIIYGTVLLLIPFGFCTLFMIFVEIFTHNASVEQLIINYILLVFTTFCITFKFGILAELWIL